jgi:hypothetical protein
MQIVMHSEIELQRQKNAEVKANNNSVEKGHQGHKGKTYQNH